nr:orf1 hypothetical protein [Sulfolobus acidocaldarius]
MITIFYIIGISLVLNMIVYLAYRFYLQSRMKSTIEYIKKYEQRISSISSPKRRSKAMKSVSKELNVYECKLRGYMFLQSMLMMATYIVGLFLILYLIVPPYVYFPYESPLTAAVGGKPAISTLIVYIVSFLVFTPLSLRRPKLI